MHRILAAVNVIQDEHDQAVYHQRRALSLNPNDDLVVVQQGEILTWLGQAEEGIDWIRKAMRLNPYHPERFWSHLGRACFAARRYAEAVEALKCITAPDAMQRALLAACHAQLGDMAAAEPGSARRPWRWHRPTGSPSTWRPCTTGDPETASTTARRCEQAGFPP